MSGNVITLGLMNANGLSKHWSFFFLIFCCFFLFKHQRLIFKPVSRHNLAFAYMCVCVMIALPMPNENRTRVFRCYRAPYYKIYLRTLNAPKDKRIQRVFQQFLFFMWNWMIFFFVVIIIILQEPKWESQIECIYTREKNMRGENKKARWSQQWQLSFPTFHREAGFTPLFSGCCATDTAKGRTTRENVQKICFIFLLFSFKKEELLFYYSSTHYFTSGQVYLF